MPAQSLLSTGGRGSARDGDILRDRPRHSMTPTARGDTGAGGHAELAIRHTAQSLRPGGEV
jgi:hypothetical protein